MKKSKQETYLDLENKPTRPGGGMLKSTIIVLCCLCLLTLGQIYSNLVQTRYLSRLVIAIEDLDKTVTLQEVNQRNWFLSTDLSKNVKMANELIKTWMNDYSIMSTKTP
jgi:hypothetical protein